MTSSQGILKGQSCTQGLGLRHRGCCPVLPSLREQRGVPGALLTLSPCRYAYIEFEEKSSVKAAVELDESVFRGRVIKVIAG